MQSDRAPRNRSHNNSMIEPDAPILLNVDQKNRFGIEGYYLPPTMHNIIKVPTWQKKDVKRFID